MTAVESYIKRHGLDALLSPELLKALRAVTRRPRELFIRAGDPAEGLLFLVEGKVKVYSTLDNGQSVLAAFYKPPDVLGEVELFAFRQYTLSAEAITDAVCLSLPWNAIRKAAERNCKLFMYLCGRLGAKLADRVIAESINLRYPVENRLASYLLGATDDEGLLLGADNLAELADFVGASYRQLARVLHRFRAKGILERSRGTIRVLARKKLEPLARDRYLSSPHIPRSFSVAMN